MKPLLKSALKIVEELLEARPDTFVKDVGQPSKNGFYKQIDGDWGDPWLYGGSWWNPIKRVMFHFEGVENDEETDPDSVPIPASMLAKLPLEQPDWQDNRERDRLIQQYQAARAAYLESHKKRDFWFIDVPDEIPVWLKHYRDAIKQTLGSDVEYDLLPVAIKLLEIGKYAGLDEIGYTIKLNKLEAEKILGFNL